MIHKDPEDLRLIKRALISVSDKTGIVAFAKELNTFNIEIISTGGTAKVLRKAGIKVCDVSDVTGFPEMMDGRVKTLHPKIHGALLGLRNKPDHIAAMNQQGIEPIDLVVVNLYPFEQTIRHAGVTEEEAIEQIDIGGPAMIRSAAKNWQSVAVAVLPRQYDDIIKEMTATNGSLSLGTRNTLAREAFAQTAHYDLLIAAYMTGVRSISGEAGIRMAAGGGGLSSASASIADLFSKRPFKDRLPDRVQFTLTKLANLRYGENPHQIAALYLGPQAHGIANAQLLSGKEMSFNNYVDADAAWQLVTDFDDLACAIIKHTNPAGVALGVTCEEAHRKALATDPISAFGGIVSFNRPVDEPVARKVVEIFTEVIVAPDYEPLALEILKSRKNLRVLKLEQVNSEEALEFRQIGGGLLVQTRDTHRLKQADLKTVSKRQPTEEEIRALLFAWRVCKHTKSNAIVYARDGQTVGVGAGQMSRVDSVRIGAMRAQLPLEGSVLASDAFFPFRDGIDEAARYGITAVIQPGGSVKDQEVIAAADKHGLAMVFTGVRHFRH